MKKANTWGSGAKLTLAQVTQLRKRKALGWSEMGHYAKAWGVCTDTIWRAYVGKSWKEVVAKTRADGTKECIICGAAYTRRFADGRYRSDKLWKQKVTCTRGCAVRHHWKRGVYAFRNL